MSVAERVYLDPRGRLCAMMGRPHFGPYFIDPVRLRKAPIVTNLAEREKKKVIAALNLLTAH